MVEEEEKEKVDIKVKEEVVCEREEGGAQETLESKEGVGGDEEEGVQTEMRGSG